jgi:O-antigen ligase
VAIAAVFVLIWHRRAALAIAGLFAGIIASLPLLFQSARFARLLDFSAGTNFFRIRVWQSAVNMISDRPLTGFGLDQFLYAFRGQYIMPDAWQEPNLSHPHNIVLDFWIRLGLLGVANLLWLQVSFWKSILTAYRRFQSNDQILLALAVGTVGSMVNLLSHGLVDNSVYVHDLCYVYVLLLGLAANLSNIRTIDESGEIMV